MASVSWMEKCFLCNGIGKIEVSNDKDKNSPIKIGAWTEEDMRLQCCPCCEGHRYVVMNKEMRK